MDELGFALAFVIVLYMAGVLRQEVDMNRQTIRTFVDVKGGVAKVLHTESVLVPLTAFFT